jgi:hypothetical protein
MNTISVIGYYTTQFGELWERSLSNLITEAVQGVLNDTKIEFEKIDAIFFANMLAGTLKSLFAVSEAYPALRASENFSKLQDELSDTENKIQAARRFYNSNVLVLNTAVEQFPTNLIANMFGFTKSDFFQMDEAQREPVAVKF